jgi:hypothetical protein
MGCSFTPSAAAFDGQSPARRSQFASLSPNAHVDCKHSSVCCARCWAARAHLTSCRAHSDRPVPLAQTLLGQAKQRIIDLPMLETPSSQHLPTRHRVEEIVSRSPRHVSIFATGLRGAFETGYPVRTVDSGISTLMRGLWNDDLESRSAARTLRV